MLQSTAAHTFRTATYRNSFPAGATVFDIFHVWRLDSGDYATEAGHVVDAWEARCR